MEIAHPRANRNVCPQDWRVRLWSGGAVENIYICHNVQLPCALSATTWAVLQRADILWDYEAGKLRNTNWDRSLVRLAVLGAIERAYIQKKLADKAHPVLYSKTQKERPRRFISRGINQLSRTRLVEGSSLDQPIDCNLFLCRLWTLICVPISSHHVHSIFLFHSNYLLWPFYFSIVYNKAHSIINPLFTIKNLILPDKSFISSLPPNHRNLTPLTRPAPNHVNYQWRVKTIRRFP